MPRFHQARRQFLKAAGYTISLPFFPSLTTRRLACAEERSQAVEPSPKRFCCIFFPNGVSLPPSGHDAHEDWHWFPHEFGPDYKLTRTLEPLASHRSAFTILSGLSHPSMRSSIAHITADSFLTGADSSQEYRNSISLDQVIARSIGHRTRFPSLALSSDGGVGAPGRTQTMSFSASGRPIPALSEPRAIFNRMFGVANHSLDEQRRAFGRDRSILDNVMTETKALQLRLSADDCRRLDEYTTSVREIEKRLESADRWLERQSPVVDPADFDLSVKAEGDAEEYIRVILDLMFVALFTDATRTITYQITSEDAKGIGDRFPISIGLTGHHSLSHGTNKPQGFEDWARYDQFLARQLAYFMTRLSQTHDPLQEGSLLDNTVLLYGGSTSTTHLARNYPLILAGGQSLGLRHGSHQHFDEDEYCLADLYVTLLQQLGLDVAQFAGGQRSLSQLLS